MTVLQRLIGKVRWLLLVTGVVASAATALSVAQPAAATNENYSCSSCAEVNGKENYVENNQANDYTEDAVCSGLWRNNGGGSYTLVNDKCTETSSEVWVCHGSEIHGHGEVEAINGNNHLAGKENNFSYCE